MPELYNQIESITDEVISSFLDAWQCQNWDVSCTRFAELLAKSINNSLTQVAREITEADEELE